MQLWLVLKFEKSNERAGTVVIILYFLLGSLTVV